MNATKREDLLKVTTIKLDDFQAVTEFNVEELNGITDKTLAYEVVGWQGIKVLVKIDAGNPLRTAEVDTWIGAVDGTPIWELDSVDEVRDRRRKFWGDTPQLFLR